MTKILNNYTVQEIVRTYKNGEEGEELMNVEYQFDKTGILTAIIPSKIEVINCNFIAEELSNPFEKAERKIFKINVARCECGAKKTGALDWKPGHSTWCPVAEKKT